RDRNVTGVQTCALPICNNSFWSAADAHEQVDGVGILSSSDGTGNVAVHDEAYLGAGFTDFRDQIIVAWAVKNDHGYFLRANAFRFRYCVDVERDRKSTRLNSSHVSISYAVFCLKKKKT